MLNPDILLDYAFITVWFYVVHIVLNVAIWPDVLEKDEIMSIGL